MDSSKMIGNSLEVSNFSRSLLKLNRFSPSKVHTHFPPWNSSSLLFQNLRDKYHFNLKTCPWKLDNHNSYEMHSKQSFSMAREGKLRFKGLYYFGHLTLYNVPRKKQISSCFQCLSVSSRCNVFGHRRVGFQNQCPLNRRSNSPTPSPFIVILLSRVAICKFTFQSIDKVFTM